MDRTFLTITPANIATVLICGLLGYWLLLGANVLYTRMTTSQAAAA